MEALIAQITTVAKGMWRFRWPALAVAWLVAIVGVVIVFRVPDQYEATARIYVDTQSILKPLMSGLAVQPNVEQQVVMLSRTLISRPNMEKLVRMADLDLDSQSKAEQEALITDADQRAPDQERGARQPVLAVVPRPRAGQGEAGDPVAGVDLRRIEPGRQPQGQPVGQDLPRRPDQELRGQARRGRDPAEGVPPAQPAGADRRRQGRGVAAGRATASSSNQAKLELREAEQSRDAARQQLQAEKAQGTSLATQGLLQESAVSVATPEIDARLDAQKRNLDALLQRFTEQHPDIVSTRRLIKDLEDQKRKEVQELRRAAMAASSAAVGAGLGAGSLAMQEMSRMLATTEVQVAALRARVAEFTARYSRGARIAEDRAADRGRSRPAEPRLRHPQEELRRPGGAARVGRHVGRARGGFGRGRLPPDRPAARVAHAGVAEPAAAAAAGPGGGAGRGPVHGLRRPASCARCSTTPASCATRPALPAAGQWCPW